MKDPIAYPAYEFDLTNDFPEITVYQPPYKISLRMKGKIVVQKKGILKGAGIDISVKSLQNIAVSVKSETAQTVSELVGRTSVVFDINSQTIALKCSLSESIETCLGKAKIDCGLWYMKFSLDAQPVKGEYKGYVFEGTWGYEVKVEGPNLPKVPQPFRMPAMTTVDRKRVEFALNTPPLGLLIVLVLAGVTIYAVGTAGTGGLTAPIAYGIALTSLKEKREGDTQ